jgi:hypothetical protein
MRSRSGFFCARPASASGRAAFSHFDASIGVRVKLTNSEMAMAKAMVRPKLFRKRPTMPPMKATGRNTARSEMVVASTARPISLVASMAARAGSIFFSLT